MLSSIRATALITARQSSRSLIRCRAYRGTRSYQDQGEYKTNLKRDDSASEVHVIVNANNCSSQMAQHIEDVKGDKVLLKNIDGSPAVWIEKSETIFVVNMSRPDTKNSVDRRTARALEEAFQIFDHDNGAHVAILFGHGGTFCSGADLKAVAAGNPNRIEPTGSGPMGPTRLNLSKPVIAAISGHAVAGGLELALWCDLRICEEDSIFGVFSRRLGVPLIDGGTVRLPRLIGLSRAMDMILTGRPVPAKEAQSIGLVNYVVGKGLVRLEAENLARRIAEFPQQCLRSDRLSTLEQDGLPERDAMSNEFRHAIGVLASGESMRGAKTFSAGAGRHGSSLSSVRNLH